MAARYVRLIGVRIRSQMQYRTSLWLNVLATAFNNTTYAVAYQQGGLEGGTPSRVKHPAAGRRSHCGKERRPAGGRALACARLADCARDRLSACPNTRWSLSLRARAKQSPLAPVECFSHAALAAGGRWRSSNDSMPMGFRIGSKSNTFHIRPSPPPRPTPAFRGGQNRRVTCMLFP